MRDLRIEKLAETIVCYSTKVKENDMVKIDGHLNSLPLLKAIYKQVLLKNAFPIINLNTEEFSEILLKNGNPKQLKFIDPFELEARKNIDVHLLIASYYNSKYLSNVPPQKQKNYYEGRKTFSKIFNDRNMPNAKKPLRWLYTEYPSHSCSQDAEMSLQEYSDFYFKSIYADAVDPVREWKKISKKQQEIINFLSKGKEVKIIAPGTNLKLSIENRKWINGDGRFSLPDGEIFTCPANGSVNGNITFSNPCITNGKEVGTVNLSFHDGIVTKATASKNEEFLHEILKVDQGAKKLGNLPSA